MIRSDCGKLRLPIKVLHLDISRISEEIGKLTEQVIHCRSKVRRFVKNFLALKFLKHIVNIHFFKNSF